MSNTMNVGSVRLFDTLCQDKAQAVKVLDHCGLFDSYWKSGEDE